MFDNISPKEIFVNYHYLSAIYNYTSEQYYIQRELILHDHLIAAQA